MARSRLNSRQRMRRWIARQSPARRRLPRLWLGGSVRPTEGSRSMTLKLGYKASAEQFAPRQLLDFSVAAEQAGFDSVFVSDHFQPWKHTDGHAPSAIPWLGALGARTKRIIMGTSVMTPTFRYHPSIVAQAFATLAVMYPNRVVLGLGSGESLNDVPAVGFKWPGFKERTARLLE